LSALAQKIGSGLVRQATLRDGEPISRPEALTFERGEVLIAAPKSEAPLLELVPSLPEVYRLHSRFVAGLAFRLLGRDGDVDDVVQDVFLAAVEGLGRLRAPGALKGWLATLTVRLARRRLRRRSVLSWVGFDDDGLAMEVPVTTAASDDLVLLRQVYEVLAEVPVDDRLAWILKYLEGESLDAVAVLCGCSLATAKRRIARAQELVERRFSDEA